MEKLGTVVVLPDTHCGSLVGLTPPQFDATPGDSEGGEMELYDKRRALWKWFSAEAKALGHVDGLVGLGDLVEGKGRKNAGADNLTSNMVTQTKMAAKCIEQFDAEKRMFIRGTPYHVGEEDQWEDVIADFLDDPITDKAYASMYGHTFYLRHKIGKSGAPAGWATAPAKELTWNVLNSVTQLTPDIDVCMYAHIHEYTVLHKWGRTAVTSPALQLPNTSFGAKNMNGNYDVGFLHIDFYENEKFDIVPHLYPKAAYAPRVTEFLS